MIRRLEAYECTIAFEALPAMRNTIIVIILAPAKNLYVEKIKHTRAK